MIMNERNKLVNKIGDNMYALIEKKHTENYLFDTY